MKINKLVIPRLRVALAVATLCLISVSCDKHEDFSPSSNIPTARKNQQDGSIPCYMFNWEATTYLPSAGGGNPVQMPWNSGTTAIDPNIVSDYKAVDGWELMYNTFSPTTVLNDPGYKYFFALYNRYRGQLRFYVWQYATPIATSHINHGLSLYTVNGTSPMLNYSAVDIVGKTNLAGFSTVLNQQLSAAGGTWLVTQYELAYDPLLSTTSFPNMGLRLKSDWVNVSQVKLNGTSTGTAKGVLGNPDPAEFSIGSFFGSFLQKGVITLLGASGSGAILGAMGSANNTAYTDALNNAKNDLVKGFFSGVLGGLSGASASTPTPISLTINTKIDMSGTIVNNGTLLDEKIVLPGQSNSQSADGNLPGGINTMGVFNISATPVVNKESSYYSTGPWEDPQYGNFDEPMQEDKYTLNPSSFSLVWNPAVINGSSTGASIANVKKEVVALGANGINGGFVNSASPMCNCGGRSYYIMIPQGHGAGETIGQHGAAVSDQSVPLLLDWSQNYGGIPDEGIAVRISFDVVPNSGAPKTKIVKTFYANVQ